MGEEVDCPPTRLWGRLGGVGIGLPLALPGSWAFGGAGEGCPSWACAERGDSGMFGECC